MATLAFSGTVHEVIHLLKAFEIGFDRKSDAKMITFIGILPYRALYSRLNILLLNLLYQEFHYQ